METKPALKTAAEPLRFLDFLIYEPVKAVLLHGGGVAVTGTSKAADERWNSRA